MIVFRFPHIQLTFSSQILVKVLLISFDIKLPFLQSQNSYSHMQSHFQIMSNQSQAQFSPGFYVFVFSTLLVHVCHKGNTKVEILF